MARFIAHRMNDLHACRAWAVACLLVMLVTPAQAQSNERASGFGFDRTRVVVSADDRSSGQVSVMNNTANIYLVQSRIWAADGVTGYPVADTQGAKRAPLPFIVTPPLKRVGAHDALGLRILVTRGAAALPSDRESLFFISAKAIPSEPADKTLKTDKAKGEAGSGAHLSLALQTYDKLFYRPAGLSPRAISAGDVAGKLSFRRNGDRLVATNPTPYHITFGALAVGGKRIDGESLRAMVPPMGSHDYPMAAGASSGDVTWQVMDEFGLLTDPEHQSLP